MQGSFNTILIPLDFTLNTEIAVCKALEIVNESCVNIHLLHTIVPNTNLLKSEKVPEHLNVEAKMKQWQESIEDYLPSANVVAWIVHFASVQKTIIDKAREVKADLIVIGKRSNHLWLPFMNTVLPSQIAKEVPCSVLSVKPGSLRNKIKNVVVPIGTHVPVQKMNAITALCKKNRIKVFLVAFSNNEQKAESDSATSLLKVYQWLRNSVPCQVEYATLQGQNKARAILNFAERNSADVLLVHPESETKIGWPYRHISDVLSAGSKIQILTVGIS